MATGGGAFKYYDEMRKVLGTEVLREDEMECLIMGLDFFITEIPREVFTYTDPDPMHFEEPRADVYPYLLVNIGSGVSMVRVSGPEQFERVGGTSLGGGTLVRTFLSKPFLFGSNMVTCCLLGVILEF